MDRFSDELKELADRTQPSAAFIDTLEQQLRAAHPASGRKVAPFRFPTRQLAAACAALLVALTAVLSIPPLRSLAQEVLDALFNRTATDTDVFATPVVVDMLPTMMVPAPYLQSIDVAQVEREAGFDVLIPTFLPEGFAMTDIYYDAVAKQVFQSYARENNWVVIDGFTIAQGLAVDAQPLDVGASAEIVPVTVGDAQGEFVVGTWFVRPEPEDGSHAVITEREWANDFPYQQMRWVDGDMMFWMVNIVGQESKLGADEWSAIANSLE